MFETGGRVSGSTSFSLSIFRTSRLASLTQSPAHSLSYEISFPFAWPATTSQNQFPGVHKAKAHVASAHRNIDDDDWDGPKARRLRSGKSSIEYILAALHGALSSNSSKPDEAAFRFDSTFISHMNV